MNHEGNEQGNLDTMVIKYWGTRGSIPAPSNRAQEAKDPMTGYGGDTTCIEIQARDSPLIILDAGSGMRRLGDDITGRIFSGKHMNPLDTEGRYDKRTVDVDGEKRQLPGEIHIIFSHYHWDHIQGIPFFVPAFLGNGVKQDIHFYGKEDCTQEISDVLRLQQQDPTFPVRWEEMPCGKEYHELNRIAPTTVKIGEAEIKYTALTHPDGVYAYRIDVGGASFVFATDNEHRGHYDPRLTKLAEGADIMYHDAQYTLAEYLGENGSPPKIDWGHATPESAITNALKAGVKTLVLGHHDPKHTDKDLDAMYEMACRYRDEQLLLAQNQGKSLDIVMAYDGLEQRL